MASVKFVAQVAFSRTEAPRCSASPLASPGRWLGQDGGAANVLLGIQSPYTSSVSVLLGGLPRLLGLPPRRQPGGQGRFGAEP